MKKHWSQIMKNKKGKKIMVGDYMMGKKMAAIKKKKKKGSHIGNIAMRAKAMKNMG